MGSFTDNLLKLTEFPFSYSFITLLVLIISSSSTEDALPATTAPPATTTTENQSAQDDQTALDGLDDGEDEPSLLEKYGPLLILMGFVATTLSISDPVGRLQKAVLVRGDRFKVKEQIFSGPRQTTKERELPRDLQEKTRELNNKSSELMRRKWEWENKYKYGPEKTREANEREIESEKAKLDIERAILASEWKKLSSDRLTYVLEYTRIFGAQLQDLIKRKVIPIHVVICLLSNFQDYRNNNEVTYHLNYFWPSKIFEKLEHEDLEKIVIKVWSLKRKTVETIWITREIDKITSMGYFIIVVATFIGAVISMQAVVGKFMDAFQSTEAPNNEQTQSSEDTVAVRNERIQTATIIISIFSFFALGAVLVILVKRALELRSKCLTAFKFLILQHAIKIQRDAYEKRLEEIRQFLADGDWTLAEVEMERLMEEYDDLVRKDWIEREEINSEEGERVEKKWNYRNLGIYWTTY
jgi:hypothetical protein